jgi:polar amino acid transport system substrate-binding protein
VRTLRLSISTKAPFGLCTVLATLGLVVSLGWSGAASAKTAKAAACTPKHKNLPLIQPGTLKVAAYNLLPFSNVSGSNLGGADGDIVTDIAKMECLKLHIDLIAEGSIIPSIQSGRDDTGVGGWYRTAARAKIVNLSGPAYVDRAAFISKSGVSSMSKILADHMSVGSAAGTLWNASLQKALGSNFHIYSTDVGALQDVISGRLDVDVDSYAAEKLYVKTRHLHLKVAVAAPTPKVPEFAHPGQINYVTNLKAKALANAISADIITLRKEGKIRQIVVKNGFPASAANPGKPQELG